MTWQIEISCLLFTLLLAPGSPTTSLLRSTKVTSTPLYPVTSVTSSLHIEEVTDFNEMSSSENLVTSSPEDLVTSSPEDLVTSSLVIEEDLEEVRESEEDKDLDEMSSFENLVTSSPEDLVTSSPEDIVTSSVVIFNETTDHQTMQNSNRTITLDENPNTTLEDTTKTMHSSSESVPDNIMPDMTDLIEEVSTAMSPIELFSTQQSAIEDTDDFTSSGEPSREEPIVFTIVAPTPIPQDRCMGVTCAAGLPCHQGTCPCPTVDQCDAFDNITDEVCYKGTTYRNPCYVITHTCLGESAGSDIRPGACPLTTTTHTNTPTTTTTTTTTIRPHIITSDANILPVVEPTGLTPGETTGVVICVIAVLGIIAAIGIVCYRRKNKKQRREHVAKEQGHDDGTSIVTRKPSDREFRPMSRPMSESRQRSSRPLSRTSMASFRASPKEKRHSQPEKAGIDPDRFSLSGCITPLEDVPLNPLTTFMTSSEPQENGSLNHSGSALKEPEDPKEDAHESQSNHQPEVEKRKDPPIRPDSAIESAVYEIQLPEDVALDMGHLDHVAHAVDDSHLTTRL